VRGRIHSIETCGTVDGPGVRVVVFLQGCALRCLYCHNPDTQNPGGGRELAAEELLEEIWKYRSFFQSSGGGVTFSGGEPLLQPAFVAELTEACRELGIHTALDTSGFASLESESVKRAVDASSLVLLDIKSFSPERFQEVTGQPLERTLAMARYLAERNHPVWIRYVLVPGLTDDPTHIEALARFLQPMKNVEKVQIMPFHKMGEYKWRELCMEYKLTDTPAATERDVNEAAEIFRRHGLVVE
jgi:pyruvate formate lyase activating enzyme